MLLLQLEGRRVHAETLVGGRRSIVEDVSQMSAAPLAYHLDAPHAVAPVGVGADAIFGDGLVEAGPARAGVDIWCPT